MQMIRTRAATVVLALVCSMVASEASAQSLAVTPRAWDFQASIARAAQQSESLVQSRVHRPRSLSSCARRLKWGFGIGAALGFFYGFSIVRLVEEENPAKLVAASTVGAGVLGMGIALNTCR